ncbi:carbon-nitrogen hydrolase family protein [Arenimonas fontis]|uniref:carbon-nitrogen hydrolase family protein n=1 Tax=Arenimonas fontis TaxID=2608255 RepID=UPI00166209CF|nr:carbon-nitrogen hydrolase family protein [Arenimonas fontis]
MPAVPGQVPARVRVAAVQYGQHRIAGFDEFAGKVEEFVRVAADYGSDFVCFPELFSLQLLSAEPRMLAPAEALERLSGYTPAFTELLGRLAGQYGVHIVGGTHPTHTGEGPRNICFVATRDGRLHRRDKLHITPSEQDSWKVQGGEEADVIPTDAGPIGIMVCYDSEFPELGRHLADQGALLLFVPYCTDLRSGHLRVRYSCQARAVENQVHVVAAGNVGHCPNVANFDIQYAQSGVYTPCDFPFPPEGIAAEASPQAEQIVFADLDLEALLQARRSGTVRNLQDRRPALYAQWRRGR